MTSVALFDIGWLAGDSGNTVCLLLTLTLKQTSYAHQKTNANEMGQIPDAFLASDATHFFV